MRTKILDLYNVNVLEDFMDIHSKFFLVGVFERKHFKRIFREYLIKRAQEYSGHSPDELTEEAIDDILTDEVVEKIFAVPGYILYVHEKEYVFFINKVQINCVNGAYLTGGM